MPWGPWRSSAENNWDSGEGTTVTPFTLEMLKPIELGGKEVGLLRAMGGRIRSREGQASASSARKLVCTALLHIPLDGMIR